MSYATIRAALDAVTESISGMDTDFGKLPVYFENVGAEATQFYLSAYFLPAPTQYIGALQNKGKLYSGVYLLTLVTPPGTGTYAAAGIVDRIVATFEAAFPLAREGLAVQLTTPPYAGASLDDETGSRTPIRILFSCCAP